MNVKYLGISNVSDIHSDPGWIPYVIEWDLYSPSNKNIIFNCKYSFFEFPCGGKESTQITQGFSIIEKNSKIIISDVDDNFFDIKLSHIIDIVLLIFIININFNNVKIAFTFLKFLKEKLKTSSYTMSILNIMELKKLNKNYYNDLIIKVINLYPKVYDTFNDIPEIKEAFPTLTKSDEYGLFERKILKFNQWKKHL